MNSTEKPFVPASPDAIIGFFASLRNGKEAVFKDIIGKLASEFYIAEISEDGSKAHLDPFGYADTHARLTLCALAPSESAFLITPLVRFQEWQGAFSLETPARVLLAAAKAVQPNPISFKQ